MSYFDKVRKKEASKKLAREVMNTPEFKKEIQKMRESAVMEALARFTFMMCGFLETRHGYKTDGLQKFLSFVITELKCTEDDENFFIEYDKYYREEYGLDVLGKFGLGIEGEQ